ncbi:MAG: AbrB/MazE/SpoVT family DNA-binding domain-containing protein [Thiobacillaceae bacterium]|jgi:antitoxin VapB|nr:AbrB/MazE/SpoVT family DNA-binding domain-containing protein [Hydrogenophilales bacterium]MBP9916593.1 AbrB/MazE/SpoVT family DNA-binding domain-containing protein [Thiobacillaceae bacterium]
MLHTKVFKSGNSQAVRLPKDFNFDVAEVEIFRRGDEIVLRKPRQTGLEIYEALTRIELPADFPDDIPDFPAETRESF